jgi:hypothetical protein
MNRLYQWFGGRTRLFRSSKSALGSTETVRTEVTIQRESTTLLISGSTAAFDVCPICGQKLASAQVDQPRLRLVEGSISQEDLPADGTSP